jgi:hypothetical protein
MSTGMIVATVVVAVLAFAGGTIHRAIRDRRRD